MTLTLLTTAGFRRDSSSDSESSTQQILRFLCEECIHANCIVKAERLHIVHASVLHACKFVCCEFYRFLIISLSGSCICCCRMIKKFQVHTLLLRAGRSGDRGGLTLPSEADGDVSCEGVHIILVLGF